MSRFSLLVLLLIAKSNHGYLGHSQRGHLTAKPVVSTHRSLSLDASDLIGMAEVTSTILSTAACGGNPGSTLNVAMEISPEPIHTAFSVATFFPQAFWLLMILFPKREFTKRVMGGLGTSPLTCDTPLLGHSCAMRMHMQCHSSLTKLVASFFPITLHFFVTVGPQEVPLICAIVHFFIVLASLVADENSTAPLAEFNEVFNPAGDPQSAFLHMVSTYPNFVAEEWSHVLTWDIFVGRYIWLDGLRRGIFTGPSVLLCNLIGPPGLLLHWLTCTLTGKPVYEPSEKQALMDL